MNVQQQIVEKIKSTKTNRQRISELNNEDLSRFLTYVIPNMSQKYPDPNTGIKNWLTDIEPGQLYRNLMGDWE